MQKQKGLPASATPKALQAGISTLLIILIVVGLVAIAGGGVFTYQYLATQQPTACTKETKVCPDGSTVSRTEPNCEFTPCPITQPDQTADWKTYTSSKLGLSFKYPKDWGDVKETYYNSATDKKRETDSNGKMLYIYFDDICINCYGSHFDRHPTITALSLDYMPWEWGDGRIHYLGKESLQEIYNKNNNPKSEQIYFNIADKIPAVRFISTNYDTMGGSPIFQDIIEIYAKPVSSDFGGIEITGPLSPELENATQQGQLDFINNFKNNKLDKAIQNKIDEFNLFISTFKFTTPITSTKTDKASGIIKSVYSKSGKNYIDIDYVTINPNWRPGGASGPVYTNDNPQIRTFEISKNAKILVGSGTYSEITYQEFSNLFVSSQYQTSNPWDIEVVDNVVTKITEHYIP